MGKYVLTYQGGSMGETETEQQEIMAKWMDWFGSLGASLLDLGNPFGPSSTIGADGSVSEGARSGLGGYSIISADSLAEACDKATDCPLLSNGGTIEVYETVAVG